MFINQLNHSVKSQVYFQKLLVKSFPVNSRLMMQIDGCSMCSPASAVFSGIYVCNMEEDVVVRRTLY